MLGATPNPLETKGDRVMKEIARDMGREEHCHPTEVAVYFGEPNKKVPDPYFEGEGPDRVGCTFCGACMTGCRIGAKNTLVKNYLYLAEKNGAEVRRKPKSPPSGRMTAAATGSRPSRPSARAAQTRSRQTG